MASRRRCSTAFALLSAVAALGLRRPTDRAAARAHGATRRGEVLGGERQHEMERARNRSADAAPARQRTSGREPDPHVPVARAIPRGARRRGGKGEIDAPIGERRRRWRVGGRAERILPARRRDHRRAVGRRPRRTGVAGREEQGRRLPAKPLDAQSVRTVLALAATDNYLVSSPGVPPVGPGYWVSAPAAIVRSLYGVRPFFLTAQDQLRPGHRRRSGRRRFSLLSPRFARSPIRERPSSSRSRSPSPGRLGRSRRGTST